MRNKRLPFVLGSALLAFSLSACSVFEKLGVRDSSSSYDKNKNTTEDISQTSKGSAFNDFKLYVGNTEASKNKNNATKEKVISSGKVKYYTHSDNIEQSDIQRAFVAKASQDRPALALRLKPEGVDKLVNAKKLGYHTILASMGNGVFATAEGGDTNLMDGVLLLPMPSLVSARDAADKIR